MGRRYITNNSLVSLNAHYQTLYVRLVCIRRLLLCVVIVYYNVRSGRLACGTFPVVAQVQ
jgi:hypothetical protein